MHLALGLFIEIISVINASFSIYYYSLYIDNTQKETRTEVIIKNTNEEQTIRETDTMHQYAVFSLILAIVLLVMGLGGFTWDVTAGLNYDYYGTPKTTNNIFSMALLIILMMNYVSMFIIVFADGGLMDVASSKAKESITGTMAVSIIFLVHLIIIGIYKLFLREF